MLRIVTHKHRPKNPRIPQHIQRMSYADLNPVPWLASPEHKRHKSQA
jgi:hypothetical protein